MLHDRVQSLSDALHRIQSRLDRLKRSQTGTLDFCKRCDELYAKQRNLLQRLTAIDSGYHQVIF